jgi:hypothetical protein
LTQYVVVWYFIGKRARYSRSKPIKWPSMATEAKERGYGTYKKNAKSDGVG